MVTPFHANPTLTALPKPAERIQILNGRVYGNQDHSRESQLLYSTGKHMVVMSMIEANRFLLGLMIRDLGETRHV